MKLSYFIFCSGVFVAAVSATAVIDPSLSQRSLGDTQSIMISFNQGIETVIQQINRMNFTSLQQKRSALTDAQQTFTNGIQAPLKTLLNTMGVQYQSFWINNKAIVPNANSALINAISKIPGVAKIEKEPVVNLNPLGVGEPAEDSVSGGNHLNNSSSRVRKQASLEWGIEKIRADKVWESFTGEGIVVAGIDTGVRYTHEALRGRWRKEFGWFDATALFPSLIPEPYDIQGHGTHTMGTMVGTHGIGVAPSANWIACKACTLISCTARALFKCGEFVQCPTDHTGRANTKNCSMAPDVINNSWGGGQGDDWYDGVIQSWRAAGIIPVFSIGNSGPRCKTANSPGDRPGVISVGSTEENDQISSFSSLGPSVDGQMKPEISAPGGNVRSAWWSSDSAYNTISGTSMAAPHVSGVVALMLNKNNGLNYNQVFNAITSTAVTSTLDESSAPESCEGSSNSEYPNNVFGHGRIDALDSVNAIS